MECNEADGKLDVDISVISMANNFGMQAGQPTAETVALENDGHCSSLLIALNREPAMKHRTVWSSKLLKSKQAHSRRTGSPPGHMSHCQVAQCLHMHWTLAQLLEPLLVLLQPESPQG